MSEKTDMAPPSYEAAGGMPTAPPPMVQQQGYVQQPAYAPQPMAYQQTTAPYVPPPGGVGGGGVPVVIGTPYTAFGAVPVELDCPRCQAHVVTECRQQISVVAWIIFAAMFGAGFFLFIPWCLSWIPFCIDSMKDIDHHCPNCKQMIGKYKRSGI